MRNHQLRLAVRAALAAGALATAVAAPSAIAQEAAADLDRVQVTGTRIKRTDIEGALPVTVIDREAIELSGFTSVADILRNTPFNSAGSFRPQSGSSAQSWAGISLRALGESRTLILLDGRRAPVAPNIGSAQDLNSIPLAAVERIEILTDGASAVYGSDAIGGVINIITRKDFTGVELSIGGSDPKRAGGETEEGSVIMGISGDRGRLMAGASFNRRGIVFQRERPWSQGGASVFSNNFRIANENPAALYGWTVGGFLPFDAGPAVPGPDACSGPGFELDGGFCFYDFTLQGADEASIKNSSLFARGTYDINMDWAVYMNAGVSRLQSFGRYAPVPSSPWPGGAPFIPVGSPNHPAVRFPEAGYDPDTPVFLAHRFAALGPRDTDIDNNLYDITVGAEGRVADFDIDFGVRQTESQYYDLGRNYVVGPIAQQFIESGRYDIYDPFSVDAATASSMIATISRDSTFLMREVYASAATDLFDMPHGPVGVAFGAEYRDEDLQDIYDSLSEGGQIVGSAGNSSGLGRNSTAIFAEALFPVLPDLEIGAALRYDSYSDYGSDTSPKLSFRWQPLPELTVRGSWGEGFRAPPLSILSQLPSFSADSVVDEQTCLAFGQPADCSTQVTTWVISNPNLDSENSDQWSLGVAFEPLDWLSGSIDWYNIKVKGRIAGIGTQTIINCLLGTATNCPPGLSNLDPNAPPPIVDAGLGVARSPIDGQIIYAQRGFTNLGTIETNGVDLNLRTNFNFNEFGRLRNELQVSWVNSYKTDSGSNVVGAVGLPEYRAILSNQYSIADFVFAWNINYIHKQDEALSPALDRTPSWTTHDIQANWYSPWNARVTLGITNLGDKDPPIDPGFGRDFNFDLYNGYGRVLYARYTQNF